MTSSASPLGDPLRDVSQIVFGIDPGSEQTAIVAVSKSLTGSPSGRGGVWTPNGTSPGILPNAEVYKWCRYALPGIVGIERARSYGMRVGASVFETCEWAGAFYQRLQEAGVDVVWVDRIAVKMHMCHDSRAKDADIRQALIDQFGGSREKAIGTKAKPGPLYGIKKDMWSALGVALTTAQPSQFQFDRSSV